MAFAGYEANIEITGINRNWDDWRKTSKQDSLLETSEDIKRRKALAKTAKFKSNCINYA